MCFAVKYNEAAREGARLERDRREKGCDDVTEGDEQYFDDVLEGGDYSDGVDSWGASATTRTSSRGGRNDENEPPHKTLDLSGLGGAVAWGEGKDPELVRLNSSQSRSRPTSAKDEREKSRREGRVVKLKTPRRPTPYNNYKTKVRR